MAPHHYRVYGRVLRSEIELPELSAIAPAAPAWTFHLSPVLPRPADARLLGSERIYGGVHARLYEHRHGHRIEVDDTGVYELSQGRSVIGWAPNPEPWWDFGRNHLLGRVLATALHFDGTLTLHGSAVATGAGVIAFLGPKRHGKTTLARRLAEAGAAFVTDDTLPVEPGPGRVLAWPGVQSLRVDARGGDGLGPRASGVVPGRDGKLAVPVPFRRMTSPRPLAAIYILQPTTQGGAPEAVALHGQTACLALVSQTKIAEMLGPGQMPRVLERCAALVRQVPVHALRVPWGLEALPDVVSYLLDRHGDLGARVSGGAA